MQYSSATFVFLRFHSGNEKFGVRFKNFTISTFYFLKLKTACPELRNLKLHSRAMSVFASVWFESWAWHRLSWQAFRDFSQSLHQTSGQYDK